MTLDKNIAVAVTGGIAAYKTCELVRELRRAGARVRVAMTEAAQRFVSALTFAALSEHPVQTSLFQGNEEAGIGHIELARWCDVLVICPATADVLGKVANGLADDLISTTVMACQKPVIFCPAMNSAMWANPIVQQNVTRLREHGYRFVEPEWGALATTSEGEGWGRLAALERIVAAVRYSLDGTRELEGKKVVVTAGPTVEPIDPVRVLSNRSSGKMGYALAEAARLRGAEVTLVSGPTTLTPPEDVRVVPVQTVAEMQQAVEAAYADCDILIMAAAVSDYRPRKALPRKLKKSQKTFALELEKTPDILLELGRKKGGRIHVGFALETDRHEANAMRKLHSKNLDLVVLNDPLQPGAGFAVDTNVVTLISADGARETLPRMSKAEVADAILNRVCALLKGKTRQVAAG